MSRPPAPATGWDALPGTLKWVVGIAWFHALLAVLGGVAMLGDVPALAILNLGLAGAWILVAVGLMRGEVWGWWLGLSLSILGIILELAQGRIGVTTNLAVLVLLLTPSGRGFIAPGAAVPPEPRCLVCGEVVPAGQSVCPRCQARSEAARRPSADEAAACPRCTSEVRKGDDVCWWCGLSLTP